MTDRNRWQRIAKSKEHILGCVTHVEIAQDSQKGGFLSLKTTATRDLWVYVPSLIFREWADHLRDAKRRFMQPYNKEDATAIKKWLRTKMIMIRCEVWQKDDMTEVRCHTIGLMKGEENA